MRRVLPLFLGVLAGCGFVSGYDRITFDERTPSADSAPDVDVEALESGNGADVAPNDVVAESPADAPRPRRCFGRFGAPSPVPLTATDGTMVFEDPHVTPDGLSLFLTSGSSPKRIFVSTRSTPAERWSSPVLVHTFSASVSHVMSWNGTELVLRKEENVHAGRILADGGITESLLSGDVNTAYAIEIPFSLDAEGLTLLFAEVGSPGQNYQVNCFASRTRRAVDAEWQRGECYDDFPKGTTMIASPDRLELFVRVGSKVELRSRRTLAERFDGAAVVSTILTELPTFTPRSMPLDACELYGIRDGDVGVWSASRAP